MFQLLPDYVNVALLLLLQAGLHYWSARASDAFMRITASSLSLFSGLIAGFIFGVWATKGGFL